MEIHPNGYWINPEIGVNHHFDQGLCDAIVGMCGNKMRVFADIGCGPGHYTKALRDAGHIAYGFDCDPDTEKLGGGFTRLDLTDHQAVAELLHDFPVGSIVLCLEVGEHIPKEKNRLVEQICSLQPFIVIISWAIPGQGGDGHVWERTNEDVIADFNQYGYRLLTEPTKALREAATLWWFKQSLMAFYRA